MLCSSAPCKLNVEVVNISSRGIQVFFHEDNNKVATFTVVCKKIDNKKQYKKQYKL